MSNFDELKEQERVLKIKDALACLIVDLIHDPSSLSLYIPETDTSYARVKDFISQKKLATNCNCGSCIDRQLLNFRYPEIDPLIDIAKKIAEAEHNK